MIPRLAIDQDGHRISECQSTVSYELTKSPSARDWLENFIDENQPQDDWDRYIASAFRYPVPVNPLYSARFRPPFLNRNCTYFSLEERTAFFELAFHALSERMHLKKHFQSVEKRILLSVSISDQVAIDVSKHPDCSALIDRKRLQPSHDFVTKLDDDNIIFKSIFYPSARLSSGFNVAVFDLKILGQTLRKRTAVSFVFDPLSKSLRINDQLWISWDDVH